MNDVFNTTDGAFSFRRLTQAVLSIPYPPLRVSSLGLFEDRRIDTDLFSIEEKAGIITVLDPVPRDAPPQQLAEELATVRPFRIPAFKQERTIYADKVLGRRAFGAETESETIEMARQQALESMTLNHRVTHEHRRLGGLQGKIYAADGVTVLVNLFTEFNVVQEAEVDFDLPTAAGGAIQAACSGIVRKIATNLGGTPFRGVRALCSSGFWDALIANAEVRESYLRWNESSWLREGKAFGAFNWGGIDWEEYRGAGNTKIPDDKAIFFPDGVPGLYLDHWAPANWLETVNRPGIPINAKAAVDPEFQAWVKIQTQSHHMPICTRPKVLMLGKKA